MKKNGFIATSLIYSFFLVFLAILAALLNNFIANKTITERFNDDVKDSLNNKRYSVIIYSKNSNIQEGITMSNLVSDGEFKELQSYWNIYGSSNFSYTSFSSKPSLLKRNSSGRSYISQTINVSLNNKYYYAINHYQNFTNPVLKTYIDSPLISIDTCNSSTNNCTYSGWVKNSKIYTSNKNANVEFVVGDYNSSYTGNSYFSEAMVINLTASFGAGNEPVVEWLDRNIDYFEGTLNYIKIDKIKNGDSTEVKFSPYNGYKKYQINCNKPVTTNMSTEIIDGRDYGTLKISSIIDDTVCNVDWSM